MMNEAPEPVEPVRALAPQQRLEREARRCLPPQKGQVDAVIPDQREEFSDHHEVGDHVGAVTPDVSERRPQAVQPVTVLAADLAQHPAV